MLQTPGAILVCDLRKCCEILKLEKKSHWTNPILAPPVALVNEHLGLVQRDPMLDPIAKLLETVRGVSGKLLDNFGAIPPVTLVKIESVALF